jgi:hypothetical protein
MQLQHRLTLRRMDKILSSNPRRELLLRIELSLVSVLDVQVGLGLAVPGVEEVALADEHRFGEDDVLGLDHFEHVSGGGSVEVGFETPEGLVLASAVVLHKVLQVGLSRPLLASNQGYLDVVTHL